MCIAIIPFAQLDSTATQIDTLILQYVARTATATTLHSFKQKSGTESFFFYICDRGAVRSLRGMSKNLIKKLLRDNKN